MLPHVTPSRTCPNVIINVHELDYIYNAFYGVICRPVAAVRFHTSQKHPFPAETVRPGAAVAPSEVEG